jgi:hypothetical protein
MPDVTLDEAIAACTADRHHVGVWRTAWPALMAACEARDHNSAETRAEVEAMLRTGWTP